MAGRILPNDGAVASSSGTLFRPTDEQKHAWLQVKARLESVRAELADILRDEHDLRACPGDALWDIETGAGFLGTAIDSLDWATTADPDSSAPTINFST